MVGRGGAVTCAGTTDLQALEQTVVAHVGDQFGSMSEPGLLLDVRPMGLDRANAQLEGRSDLAVRVAQRDQSEDLDLTRGELVGRPGGRSRRDGEPGSELRVEIDPALRRKPDSTDELAGRLPP
jgi:hypothetical protein